MALVYITSKILKTQTLIMQRIIFWIFICCSSKNGFWNSCVHRRTSDIGNFSRIWRQKWLISMTWSCPKYLIMRLFAQNELLSTVMLTAWSIQYGLITVPAVRQLFKILLFRIWLISKCGNSMLDKISINSGNVVLRLKSSSY